MRTFNGKNKKSFMIFAIVLVLILAGLSLLIVNYMKHKEVPRSILKDSVVYDDAQNLVDVSSDGLISQNWDGNYSLKLLDNKTAYNLGSRVVVYNPNTNKIDILGGGFEVFGDGEVQAIDPYTTLQELSTTRFFKICDRRYLMVGSKIANKDDSFATSNYIEIIMDKAGNAQLINDSKNFKTIKPMTLTSNNMAFDISNEKLIISGNEVDLKRINGSTNEYKPNIDISADNGSDGDANNQNANNGNGGGGGGGGGGTNYGNNSANSPNANQSQNGAAPPSSNETLKSRIQLNNIEPAVTSLTVNYYISDPEGRYINAFLEITDPSGEIKRLELNKFETFKSILNLQTNSTYIISLGFTSSEKNRLVEQIVDTKTIATKPCDASIEVLTLGTSKITAKVKTDKSVMIDSATVAIYAESVKIGSATVDRNMSMSSEGFIMEFKIPDTYKTSPSFTLKLQDVMYEGEPLNMKAEIKVINQNK